MQRSNIAIVTLILFALSITLWLSANDINQDAFLSAEKAIIEVSDLDKNQAYQLGGEWAFYPNALVNEIDVANAMFVQPGHDWKTSMGSNQGFATYTLRLRGLRPNVIYGLLLEEAGTSHRVYVNGDRIMENGHVAKNELIQESATYATKAAFISDAAGEALIEIEVANFEGLVGGLITAPIFGVLDAVDMAYQLPIMTEVFIFASLLAVSFVFLFLHFIVNDVRSLFMSILSSLIALRIISTGSHLIYQAIPYFDLPLIWVIRLEYLSVFLMLPVMLLLIGTFNPFKYPKQLKQLLYVPLALMPLITFVATEGILSFMYQLFQVVLLLSGLYLMFLLVQAYRDHRVKLINVLVLIFMILLALLLGIYFNSFSNFLYFMLYVFVLFVGTTVMHRFSLIRSHSEKLATSVKIDALTGLYNRVYLNEMIQNAVGIDQNQTYHVIFIDMNNFKEINDEYGHEIGDQVLRICAKRMRNSTHESDLIFRFGGDEFLIIAERTERSDVKKMIKRIRDNFSEPIALNHLYLKITVAIGHETFDPSTDDLKEVISQSDQRMYEDKRRAKF